MAVLLKSIMCTSVSLIYLNWELRGALTVQCVQTIPIMSAWFICQPYTHILILLVPSLFMLINDSRVCSFLVCISALYTSLCNV